ncbi:MAG: hypothetical protein U1F41_00135 [Burkholderiales bacterium]
MPHTRLADAIRARGFRRWYERQLYESHAHLLTGLLSLIMMALALEMIEFRQSASHFLLLVAIGVGGSWLCVFAWRRFTFQLFRAEYMAERATCVACSAYGRLAVVSAHPSPQSLTGCALHVRCRACGHEWTID